MAEQQHHKEADSIKLNSEREDIQRMLGHPPGWTLRWGITAVLLAVLLFLAMSWLIKYPDVIEARIVILTENPPVRVFSRANGKISQLMARDKEEVQAGQILAVLENTARLEDVRKLEAFLQHTNTVSTSQDWQTTDLPGVLQLGELLDTYSRFQQLVRDYQFFKNQQGIEGQIQSLNGQIQYLQRLNTALEQQETTLSQEVELAKNNLDRNRGLRNQGAISLLDYEQAETNYLQYRRQLESLQSQVLNNQLQIEQLKAQIITLQQGRAGGLMEKRLAIDNHLDLLRRELQLWKQAYLITSPIAGKLSLTRVWSPQQFVQENEEVATVVPGADTGEIIGKAILPVFNSGKVQKGQTVNILLDAYPHQEFGVLQGQIEAIALVPDQNNYMLDVSLPAGMETTYNRSIPFAQELSGRARIITADRNLLSRIFDQLISLIKNY